MEQPLRVAPRPPLPEPSRAARGRCRNRGAPERPPIREPALELMEDPEPHVRIPRRVIDRRLRVRERPPPRRWRHADHIRTLAIAAERGGQLESGVARLDV